MRYSLFLLLCFSLCFCTMEKSEQPSASENDVTELHSSGNQYRLIRDDLYEGIDGKLYHKVLDRSAADDPKNPEKGLVICYNRYMYKDTLVDGEVTFTTPLLGDVIDKHTFRKLDSASTDGRFSYYKDTNHHYHLFHVADGGLLHLGLEE